MVNIFAFCFCFCSSASDSSKQIFMNFVFIILLEFGANIAKIKLLHKKDVDGKKVPDYSNRFKDDNGNVDVVSNEIMDIHNHPLHHH